MNQVKLNHLLIFRISPIENEVKLKDFSNTPLKTFTIVLIHSSFSNAKGMMCRSYPLKVCPF